MSFYIGKLTSHMSKNHHEYFDGVIGGIPIRGAWSKKDHRPNSVYVFVDEEKMAFISKKNEAKIKASIPAAPQGPAQEEHKA